MNIRTDLALEGIKTANVKSGIKEYKRGRSFKVTEIIIDNDNYLQTRELRLTRLRLLLIKLQSLT